MNGSLPHLVRPVARTTKEVFGRLDWRTLWQRLGRGCAYGEAHPKVLRSAETVLAMTVSGGKAVSPSICCEPTSPILATSVRLRLSSLTPMWTTVELLHSLRGKDGFSIHFLSGV